MMIIVIQPVVSVSVCLCICSSMPLCVCQVSVICLVVNCHSGGAFSLVEAAQVTVCDTTPQVANITSHTV